jgi:hypothetical protein
VTDGEKYICATTCGKCAEVIARQQVTQEEMIELGGPWRTGLPVQSLFIVGGVDSLVL